jgi:hypothetical protein
VENESCDVFHYVIFSQFPCFTSNSTAISRRCGSKGTCSSSIQGKGRTFLSRFFNAIIICFTCPFTSFAWASVFCTAVDHNFFLWLFFSLDSYSHYSLQHVSWLVVPLNCNPPTPLIPRKTSFRFWQNKSTKPQLQDTSWAKRAKWVFDGHLRWKKTDTCEKESTSLTDTILIILHSTCSNWLGSSFVYLDSAFQYLEFTLYVSHCFYFYTY